MNIFDECLKNEDRSDLVVFQCGPKSASQGAHAHLQPRETPWPHHVRSLDSWRKLIGHDVAVVFLGQRGQAQNERLVGVEVQLPTFGVQYSGVRLIELHGYSIRKTAGTAKGTLSSGYLKLFVADDETVCVLAGEKQRSTTEGFSFIISIDGNQMMVTGHLDDDIVRMNAPQGRMDDRECIVWSARARSRKFEAEFK